jgi:hypothetical protein
MSTRAAIRGDVLTEEQAFGLMRKAANVIDEFVPAGDPCRPAIEAEVNKAVGLPMT